MVLHRPLDADVAERHAAERVTRRGMDQREVEVADEERERHVHQAVVEDDRAREAEARVLLAEPEQEPGDAEQDRERGGEDRVDLLARVEPSLRCPAAAQPEDVVAVMARRTGPLSTPMSSLSAIIGARA